MKPESEPEHRLASPLVDASTRSNAAPPWPGRRRPQLADEVVQYVRALIMSGEVEQGSFLRLEKLAKNLGVSATPVREAMAALERDGFVRLEPRRGYVVSGFTRQDIADVFMVEAFAASELAARRRGACRASAWPSCTGSTTSSSTSSPSASTTRPMTPTSASTGWCTTRRSSRLSWLVSTIIPYSPHGYTTNDELRRSSSRVMDYS